MVTTPSLSSECAEMIMRIITLDLQGIFHCCGGESVSRIELDEATAEVFGLDESLLRTGPAKLSQLASIPIPRDASLSALSTAERPACHLPNARGLLGTFRHQLEPREV